MNQLNRQIILCRCNRPLNTLRRIVVAVPSRVEFEQGFYRWIERLARLAENLSCRIIFHGRIESTSLINEYIRNQHPGVRAEYVLMEHWKEFTQLAQQMSSDFGKTGHGVIQTGVRTAADGAIPTLPRA